MAFRMILVGLVVGLGLELPSRGDIEAQARSGGAGRGPGSVEAGREADRAFSAVVEEMVVAFGRESGRAEAAAPAPAEAEVDLYPGLGYALNREAEGLTLAAATAPSPAAEPTAWSAEDEVALEWVTEMARAMPDPEPPAVSPEPASGARGERLVMALRLTGEAVHAWVTFLQQAPAVAANHP